jgi:hypothetical protein
MCSLRELTSVIEYLATLYPHFQMGKGTPAAYLTILGDLPYDVLKAAAAQIGSSSTFFPAAAELRKAAMAMVERADGRLSGAEAWEQVCREIRVSGYYRTPQFSDPVIYRAVESLGGWQAVCLSENVVADRAHFLKIYDVLATRRHDETAMLPLVRETIEHMRDARLSRQLAPGDGFVRLADLIDTERTA